MVRFLCFHCAFLDNPCSYAHVPTLDNAILCLTGGASETSEKVLYETCMNACLRDGEVWVAGVNDQIYAVSFWIRPGADFHIG
jgi:hypothetical protein